MARQSPNSILFHHIEVSIERLKKYLPLEELPPVAIELTWQIICTVDMLHRSDLTKDEMRRLQILQDRFGADWI
jgi:hypothetical protein